MIIRRCLIAMCLISSVVFAQDIIKGSYSYTFGDSESLVGARQTCKDLAIREAIESYYIFVESSTEVESFQMKEDLIQSIAAGFLQNLNIVSQDENDRTISMTVEASVNPGEVKKLVQKLLENRETDDPKKETRTDLESEDKDLPPVSTIGEPGKDAGTVSGTTAEFSLVYSDYQSKWKSAQSFWKNKNYASADKKMREMKIYLQNRNPGTAHPFDFSMYRTLWNHSLLVNDLLRLDFLESKNYRKRAGSRASSVVKQIEKLRNSINSLQEIWDLSDSQKSLRSRCIAQCKTTLAAAKSKTKKYIKK
jgi:hypothetical protein